MSDSTPNGAKPRRTRRKQRQPGFHPFFRRRGSRRYQDGYRVFWYEAEARRRCWVRTEKEAEDLVAAKQGAEVLAKSGYNQASTFLAPLQVRAAEQCFQALHDGGYLDLKDVNTADRLVLAVKWFLANYRAPSAAPTVADFALVFKKSRAMRDKRTRDDYNSTLKPFVEAHAQLPIDKISPVQISEFLHARPLSNTTKSKLWSILRVFFNLACRETEFGPKWLIENPVKKVTRPIAVSPKRIIYSLEEVKDLIQVAIYLGCAPLVVFRLFTALRADEAARFLAVEAIASTDEGAADPNNTKGKTKAVRRDYRTDLNWDTKLVDYQEPTNSKYSRKIPITSVLGEWLRLFEARGIAVRASRLEEEARRIAVPKKFGDGYDNLIRHTAISHYVADSKSLSRTAYIAGTSEGIIRKHYLDYVSPETAAAFYQLGPDKFDLSTLYAGRQWRSDDVLQRFVSRYPRISDFIARRTHHRTAQRSNPPEET